MRYKKYPTAYIRDPNETWRKDNWCKQALKDCMLRHDEMFLLSSSIFPSNVNFYLSLLVNIIKTQKCVDFTDHKIAVNRIINYYYFDNQKVPRLY